ncbi:hypothetical protein MMC15_006422 [Xylographa vitiligo]|nr:hypothetical protein [Xylographa vitiligo]
MSPIYRFLSIPFRIGELAFAATVAGLAGYYLQRLKAPDTWPEPRFIYMEVIAGLSMLSAIMWLPFSWARISYPLEICLLFAWLVTLGLLVNYIGPLNCGSIWDWGQITTGSTCSQWKAAIAFSLLSAVCWLFTAIMGVILIHRQGNWKGWWRPAKP